MSIDDLRTAIRIPLSDSNGESYMRGIKGHPDSSLLHEKYVDQILSALLKEFLDMIGEDEILPKLTTILIDNGGGPDYLAIPVRNAFRAELRTKAKEKFDGPI